MDGKDVLLVNLVRGDELLHPPMQGLELVCRYRLVARMPPDRVLAGRFLDKELVLRGPAGVLARFGGQSARRDDGRLLTPDRVLLKQGRASVRAHDGDLCR